MMSKRVISDFVLFLISLLLPRSDSEKAQKRGQLEEVEIEKREEQEKLATFPFSPVLATNNGG